jgi:GNAT superfamily N-acetyltransferase
MRSESPMLSVQRFAGVGAEPYLPELARLRIQVFREWPYLYEGTLDYEHRYLQSYLVPQALIVIAFDGKQVVGASTALPLLAHADVAPAMIDAAGLPPAEVFYFGESVLDAGYRGRGIGHRFFDEREGFARDLGYRHAAFCAVERPAQHPSRPPDYVPHDAFWTKRGYVRHPEVRTSFSWRDVGEASETEKPMVFWIKPLEQSP